MISAANFLGFQTYHCSRHFLSSCTRVLGLDVTPREVSKICNAHPTDTNTLRNARHGTTNHVHKVRYNNRSTVVGVYPVGIDPDQILQSYDVIREKANAARKLFPETKLIVGRDRLDNLMGILEKLKAVRSFHFFFLLFSCSFTNFSFSFLFFSLTLIVNGNSLRHFFNDILNGWAKSNYSKSVYPQ